MTGADVFEIVEPKTEQELEECYQLRYERLRKPLGQPPGSERETADAASTNMIVKADRRVIAAGAWAVGMRQDSQTGKRVMYVRLRQLAVDPEFEGRGIGSAIVKHVEVCARKISAAEVVANVRLNNVELFKRQGWAILGPGETLFDTLEHVSMVRDLT